MSASAPALGDVAAAVADARAAIRRAAERSGRDPDAVRLVAATKTVEPARILEAVRAGVVDLGENRVQEAVRKQPEIGVEGLRWHLIGHLQTNKAARAAAVFDCVHSVDGERVAAALAQRRPERLADLDVLLEVELTGLPNRSGFDEDALEAGLRAVAAVPRLRVVGLMTMAAPADDPETARPLFARLRALRDRLQEAGGVALPELSMGMSDDYAVAVEEGATMVRLGRAIFGARVYPPAVPVEG